LEDSSGAPIWTGPAGPNVTLAPDGRSFVATGPFDDKVELFLPEVSKAPVFCGPEFVVSTVTYIADLEGYALLGEDSLVILSRTGERISGIKTGAHLGAEIASNRGWTLLALPVSALSESSKERQSAYDTQYGVRVLDHSGKVIGGIVPRSGWRPQRLALSTDRDTVIVVATDLDLSAWTLGGELRWRDQVFDSHHLTIDVTTLPDGTIVLVTRTPQSDIFEARIYDKLGNRLQVLTLPDWLSLGSANSRISELPDGRLFLQGENAAAFLVRD